MEAEALGLPRGFPRVGPEAVKGIELNPYAAELARVSIWIGEIQWMRENGFSVADNPILKPLDSIECGDALIRQSETGEWHEATWPTADVIVGNPPFLGNKKMISELGEEYTTILRHIFSETLPGAPDLVAYWFDKSRRQWAQGLQKFGLVATNSIRSSTNRSVLQKITHEGAITRAWSDEAWVNEGASVRVSMVIADKRNKGERILDGRVVDKIPANLGRSIVVAEELHSLAQNAGTAFVGVILNGNGHFELDRAEFEKFALAPRNVNNRPNSDVIRMILNGENFNGRRPERWVIDFGSSMSVEDAAYYEEPFRKLECEVKPYRQRKKEDGSFEVRAKNEREKWWLHARSRPTMRKAFIGLSKYIATPMVSSTRTFDVLPIQILPDQKLVAFRKYDFTTLGILQSGFHFAWTVETCEWIGAGNDITYAKNVVFETFPFPEGLTPDIPAEDYADDPRAQAIAAAAARLNELRENWLNPPDLVKRVPEVVEGYPDRILPVDEAAEKTLKKRTLTNLYNERPAWLDHAHRALDEAVADAYGWGDDFRAGTLTDEEILKRLFELNQARAASQ